MRPINTVKTGLSTGAMLGLLHSLWAGLVAAGWMRLLRTDLMLFALALLPVILLGNRLGLGVSGRISDPAWRTAVGVVLGVAALGALLRLL